MFKGTQASFLHRTGRSGARRPVKASIIIVMAAATTLVVSPLVFASSPFGGQFQVNTTIGSGQEQAAAATDGAGNFVIAWSSYSSSGNDASARSIQARRFNAAGSPTGPDFQVNTTTTDDQKTPAVAMNSSGVFVVVWTSNHGTSDYDIMAQRFNAAGAKAGPELLVNNGFTAGVQSEPAVAMADNGDFVVVWSGPGGAGGDPNLSIQGRRFKAATGAFLDQFLVNNITAGDQDQPAIATNGKFKYIIAWREPAISSDVALRTFTADAQSSAGMTPTGSQLTANTYPSGPQTSPTVAMASDGRAVVAWESFGASFGNDNQRISVQARRIDASGAFADPDDVQLNTYVIDDQRFPSVTIAANGVWAATWQSYGSSGNDGSDYSIQLRAFDADGHALDPTDVQVNTYTTNAQLFPAVVLAPTGRALVVWESTGSPGNDSNGTSIQGRLYQVFSPPRRSMAIPAAARVQGNGAFFTSRVDLFHPGSGVQEVAATFVPRADIGGAARSATVSVPANTQLGVTDPLGTWFGFAGNQTAVGSLLLDVDGGDLLAQSVVFARNDDGTEFGQFFPAFSEDDALAAGEVGYLASAVNARVYRVNVGLMGIEDGTVVTVTPQARIGTPLATGQTFTLDRGDNLQLNNVFNVFGLQPRDNIVIAVRVDAGKALAFASILDGNLVYPGTSDPTTILPVTGGAQQVTLLELGPITGLNEFSGSAVVTNFSSSSATVKADLFARGTPGIAATTTFTIPGGESRGFEDMVGELFSRQGVGTVRLTTQNGTLIAATGREFAIYRGGQGQVTGTAGQLIPGMLPDDRLESGVRYHVLGLCEVDNAAGRERSHIAAFNPGTGLATLKVEVFDGATGTSEGSTNLTVRAGELIQTNSIIAVVNPGQNGNPKRLEVTASAPLYVRAFRVNKDGDPVTIPPQRVE